MARERTAIGERLTSLFIGPEDTKAKYWPSKDIHVKSKVEYILYNALDKAQSHGKLKFTYEAPLNMKLYPYTIHPDFTIWVDESKYYWEHLGETDCRDYAGKWLKRHRNYEETGLLDRLVTTDDLEGVESEIVEAVVEDLSRREPKGDSSTKFSKHHYQLYR